MRPALRRSRPLFLVPGTIVIGLHPQVTVPVMDARLTQRGRGASVLATAGLQRLPRCHRGHVATPLDESRLLGGHVTLHAGTIEAALAHSDP
jgi:hypothetical protein